MVSGYFSWKILLWGMLLCFVFVQMLRIADANQKHYDKIMLRSSLSNDFKRVEGK